LSLYFNFWFLVWYILFVLKEGFALCIAL